MADKKKIGEVSVGVVPDADGFKEKAEAQLKKEQPRDLSIKFMTELEGQEQVVSGAKATAEAAQKAAKDITIKVNVDDVGSVQNAISRIQTELTNLGAKQFKIGLNEGELNSFLDKFQDDLDRLSHVNLKYDEADPASLKKAMGQIDRELEKLRPEIPVHLDEKSLLDERKKLERLLQDSARFELKIGKVNESSLKDAIKQIDDQIAKIRPPELKISAKVTEDSLQREKARLQNELANEIRLKAKLDQAAFAKVTAEARALIEQTNVQLKIGAAVDPVKVQNAITELSFMLKERDELVAKIGAELDPFAKAKLTQEFRKLDAEIQAFAPNAKVAVNPEVTESSKGALAATLAVITRKREIPIDLDFKGALAEAGAFFATLATFTAFKENIIEAHKGLLNLFTNLPSIATMTTLFLGAAGSVIALTSNVIGLAGSFAQLLPLAAALPGIAIGMATMVAALKDLPAQLPAIAAGFKNLQTVISEAFWSVARGPINALATEALPLISAGLEQTSSQIGGFFAALSGSLSTSLLPALPGMFDRLAQSIAIFTQHTPALANLMTMFGQLGSSLLPPLAELMGQIVDDFSAWFQTNVAGEKMQETINGVMNALTGVFDIVRGLSGIFGQLFQAASAAGGSSFMGLGAGLQGIADVLKTVQPQLTEFFASAHAMFTAFFGQAKGGFQEAFSGITAILSATLPTIGSVLGQVVGALGGLLNDPQVIAGFTAFISGVGEGVRALLPALTPIAGLIGSLGPVLGLLATQIGETFAALAPSFGSILQSLMPLINVLAGGFQTILVALSPVISKLADALAQAFSNPALLSAIDAIVNAVVALLPALSPLIDVALLLVNAFADSLSTILEPLAGLITQLVPLFPMLAEALTGVAGQMTSLMPLFMDLLTSVLVPLIPVMLDLVQAILPLLPPVLMLVSAALQLAMVPLQLIIAVLLPPLIFLLENLIRAIDLVVSVISVGLTWALDLILSGVAKVREGIEGFSSWWEGIWGKIIDFFKGIWEKAINWIKDFLGIHSPSKLFVDIAHSLVDGLTNGLTETWHKVTDFFSKAWNWVKNTASNTIDAVTGFFRSMWGKVTGAIGDLAGKVKSFFSKAWDQISVSMYLMWTSVSDWLSGLGGRIISTIGNLGSLLLDIGKSIMTSLWDGLKAVWSDVAGWLGGLGDKIKGLKGPENYDAVLLVHAGELIIQGLLKGMESQYDAVRKSLAGFTNEIGSTQFGSPAVALGVSPGSYTGSGDAGTGNTLIYHAAPGSSLGAEEDLYSAIGRARAFGW